MKTENPYYNAADLAFIENLLANLLSKSPVIL